MIDLIKMTEQILTAPQQTTKSNEVEDDEG